MIHSSGALAPGMRAITSYSGFRLQSDLTRRCTLAGPGPPRPAGVDVALDVAVLPRVRVDEAADRAVLGRDLGLDAAPRPEIARDHDRALHRDSQALEPVVVGGDAVVHVDERCSDVPV